MTDQTEAFIRSILESFGTYDEAARVLEMPKPTVHAWSMNRNIPHWRRSFVIKAARRRKIALTEQQLCYLQGKETAVDFLKDTGGQQHCTGLSEPEQHYSFAAHPYSKEI